jgi:uroporphyrinogen decarboxylase
MTPLERFSLLLIDEAPDRLIAAPLVTTHSATVAGLAPGDCLKDGALMARAQLAAQERYGHDAFTIFSDVGILAEAMGSTYVHREHDVPIIDEPAVKDPSDLDRLRIPGPEDGRLPMYVDAVRALHEARGDRVPVFCLVPAPFTTAAGLRGAEDFLVDTITDPEFALALLEAAEQAAVPILDEVVLAGGLPVLVDPLASASVASPAAYRKFALPGTRRLIEHLHRLDLDIALHICGETEPILEDIAATGADLLSFDKTPVAEARSRLGDRVRLVGNVSPQTLLGGTVEEVRAEAEAAARDGMGTPKGFVLSTGCEVPIMTPQRNVAALIHAARAVGGEG